MISNHTVLSEIEKYVAQAKEATSELKQREQFAAIRALCDIALVNEGHAPHESQTPSVSRQLTQAITPVQTTMPARTIPTQKLQEADANGDSLFDF